MPRDTYSALPVGGSSGTPPAAAGIVLVLPVTVTKDVKSNPGMHMVDEAAHDDVAVAMVLGLLLVDTEEAAGDVNLVYGGGIHSQLEAPCCSPVQQISGTPIYPIAAPLPPFVHDEEDMSAVLIVVLVHATHSTCVVRFWGSGTM